MKLLTPAEHKQQEDLITRIYTKELKTGDVFLDVGANIGHHTWRMGECVGAAGKGYAIEPVPEFIDKLKRVLAIKKIDWVEIIPHAVSDNCFKSKFYFRQKFPGWSSLLERHHHPEDQLKNYVELDVEVSTLDALFNLNVNSLKLMKLDIEGSELPALRGGRELISAFEPVIVLENVVPVAAHLNGYSTLEFFKFFIDIDYDLYDLFGNLVPVEIFNKSSNFTYPIYYLALPKKHKSMGRPKSYYALDLLN